MYCPECGEAIADNARYCRACGADVTSSAGEFTVDDVRVNPDAGGSRDTEFYIGVVAGVLAVVFLPFVFFLVALPEAILALWGRSIQDSLGRDARDNPFVSGSLLIMRWFGNFLILMIVLGFLLGILLAF